VNIIIKHACSSSKNMSPTGEQKKKALRNFDRPTKYSSQHSTRNLFLGINSSTFYETIEY
jgi:hypothetical protein